MKQVKFEIEKIKWKCSNWKQKLRIWNEDEEKNKCKTQTEEEKNFKWKQSVDLSYLYNFMQL